MINVAREVGGVNFPEGADGYGVAAGTASFAPAKARMQVAPEVYRLDEQLA